MQLHEYVSHDAIGLADLVRRKEVTPRELVDTAFRAIAAVNPRLNAVIDQCVGHARSQALEVQPDQPFYGAPFLIKDSLERKGLKAAWGVTLAADNVSQRTHEIARRIDAAGLITVGRTNMSELGLLPSTEAALYGPTHNPWDLGRSPGGSSGGSASAVAAGIVPMAHGEDGGGSVRIPAGACGLWGLKVGKGRYPQETWDSPDGFICHGVVSRSVRDSAAFVDAIHGARPFDRWHAPAVKGTFADAAKKDPKKLRVGFTMRGLMASEVHPDCRAAVEKAAKLLASLGHEVEPADLPLDGDMFAEHFTTIWAMSTGYFVRAAIEELVPHKLPARLRSALLNPRIFSAIAWAESKRNGFPTFEPMTRRLLSLNAALTPADHWMAWAKLNIVAQPLYRALEKYDVVLTPTLGEPPWRTKTFALPETNKETADKLLAYAGFTPLCNTTGLPAMNLPLHWNAENLPIGVQIIGAFGSEQLLLSIAGQCERAREKPPTPSVWCGDS